MAVTYGGVPLTFPTIGIRSWIEANITLRDVFEFAYDSWLGGRLQQFWPYPTQTLNQPPHLGRLHWPVGASRWASFHFLATNQQLSAIRQQAYQPNVNGGYSPLTLVLDDGNDRPVETSMYMLPCRPLAQAGPLQGESELYLVTLVDVRYLWWEMPANIIVTGGTTTWANMFSLIQAVLGNIFYDTISSNYLGPSSDLTSVYQPLPLLLDSVCASIGQRLVRLLNGRVVTQNARTAAKVWQSEYYDWDKSAGGTFRILSSDLSQDQQALVPANVMTVFPSELNGTPTPDTPYTYPVSLASLGLPEYKASTNGHPGTKIVNTEAIATYTGGMSPTNETQLNAMATQVAIDYYLWRLAAIDIAYTGIAPWIPEGYHDVIWDWSEPVPKTRVFAAPVKEMPVLKCQGSGGSSGDTYYFSDVTITVTNNSTINITNNTTVNITNSTENFYNTIVTYNYSNVTYINTIVNITGYTVFNFGFTTYNNTAPPGIFSKPTQTVTGAPTWNPNSGYFTDPWSFGFFTQAPSAEASYYPMLWGAYDHIDWEYDALRAIWVPIVSTGRTPVMDTDHTAITTDRIIAYKTLTASRTVTLPPADSLPAGFVLRVVDESGYASKSIPILVERAGTDNVNNQSGALAAVRSQFGKAVVETDGVSNWTLMLPQVGVFVNGTLYSVEKDLNFVPGGSISITASDSVTNERSNINISDLVGSTCEDCPDGGYINLAVVTDVEFNSDTCDVDLTFTNICLACCGVGQEECP